MLNAIFYGLDLKDLPDYPQQVYRVTTDDIQRVSQAYPRVRAGWRLCWSATPPSSSPGLKKAGFDNYELVKLDELDLTAVNLKHVRRADAAPGTSPPAR